MNQTSLRQRHRTVNWLLALLAAVSLTLSSPACADPPERVARLSVIAGELSHAPADSDDWRTASLNRPLAAGDRLYSARDGRGELDLGSAVLRMDGSSELRLLNLDSQRAQFHLPEGTLNVTVRKLYDEQFYQIDTPNLALVIREPGAYRIDARRGATQITVFDGDADVYGDNDTQRRLSARQSYRFPGADLRDHEAFGLPRADEFDNWCFARDERYRDAPARRYVSDEMVGYAELDDYGDWRQESSYGPVWYPRYVVSGWAPYRDGHWAWIAPWGWTWVDHAPWGFAPSHYGRWIWVHNRWGWVPGPRTLRPVYAPAVVAFIGGSNWSISYFSGSSPVGWYPLGPRDLYVPPYRVSQTYFKKVNVTNITHTTVINNTTINNVYNNVAAGRPASQPRHEHRGNPAAVTAVDRDAFVNGKSVARAQRPLRKADIERADVITTPAEQPRARLARAADKRVTRTEPRALRIDKHRDQERRAAATETRSPATPAPQLPGKRDADAMKDSRPRDTLEQQTRDGKPVAQRGTEQAQRSDAARNTRADNTVPGESRTRRPEPRDITPRGTEAREPRATERTVESRPVAPRSREEYTSSERDKPLRSEKLLVPDQERMPRPRQTPQTESRTRDNGNTGGKREDRAATAAPAPRQVQSQTHDAYRTPARSASKESARAPSPEPRAVRDAQPRSVPAVESRARPQDERNSRQREQARPAPGVQQTQPAEQAVVEQPGTQRTQRQEPRNESRQQHNNGRATPY